MSADYEIRRLEQKLSNLEFDKDAELDALRARIAELEADALARLIEEPTNERIMKDVYDENERLKAEREQLIDQHISELADLHVKITSIEHDYLEYKSLKEYGAK